MTTRLPPAVAAPEAAVLVAVAESATAFPATLSLLIPAFICSFICSCSLERYLSPFRMDSCPAAELFLSVTPCISFSDDSFLVFSL